MANQKDNKSAFSFKRLIYNDKYLIIVSIILAFVIWIVASINIGTDEAKTISIDVPISLGDEVADQLGMQYYSLQKNIELKVTISGPKYVIGQATSNDLTVKFDTSSVNRTGAQVIPILVTNNSKTLDFEVSSVYPSSIEAYFDVNKTQTFDLNLQYDENAVEDGYSFGTPILSEDKVVISGPQTYVDKITSAMVKVDVPTDKKLTEPYNSECPIDIVGIGVETSYLTMTSRTDSNAELKSVSVTLPVLKNTVLPVAVEFEDEPVGIGNNVSVSYSKTEINAGVLDSADITKAVIGTIDYNDLKVGKNEFTFNVNNLQGITVLDDIKSINVVVNVSNNYEVISIPVDISQVLAEGVPKGYKASVKSLSKDSVSIVAPKGTKLTANDIEIKCDVSEIKKDNEYTAQIDVLKNKQIWVYGEYSANILLSKINND